MVKYPVHIPPAFSNVKICQNAAGCSWADPVAAVRGGLEQGRGVVVVPATHGPLVQRDLLRGGRGDEDPGYPRLQGAVL